MSLIKIQNELKAPKNQRNKFGNYNYRSCEDIMEALKPILIKYDATLVITDVVKDVMGVPYIEANAQLKIGKDIYATKAQAGIDPNRKGMDIAQSFGSSSSYARKYALNGLFLIDDTKDADATNDHKPKDQIDPRDNIMSKITTLLANDKKLNDIEFKLSDEIKTIGDFYSWVRANKGKGKVETYQKALNTISNKG